ncbi:hypothetical protein E2562_016916 [Oryza meyeriana var. granulata]|uniref:Uncharacterized protein n=1 Tax=Oryza meyeriana var. granulata TaxID=110450 RepID=A0A6G1DX71_9ORYZ|nr:hypothetical protein E2562_016916 [Oryza meyeriana var. granulata]
MRPSPLKGSGSRHLITLGLRRVSLPSCAAVTRAQRSQPQQCCRSPHGKGGKGERHTSGHIFLTVTVRHIFNFSRPPMPDFSALCPANPDHKQESQFCDVVAVGRCFEPDMLMAASAGPCPSHFGVIRMNCPFPRKSLLELQMALHFANN